MARKDTQISPAEKTILGDSLPFLMLAKDAYNTATTQPPPGWTVIASTSEQGRQHVDGFFARVYQRTDGGQPQYAVAFRGTSSLADIKDIQADADIFLKRLPGQYEQALNFVNDVCREKNIDPAYMAYTGHSLGGYLAAAAGLSFNSKNIWTFNAPAPNAGTWQKIEAHQRPGESAAPGRGWVQISSASDIIGKWGDYEGATRIDVDTVGQPHMLDNLRHAISQTLNGEPVTAVGPVKKGFLSRVFNNVSRALATSAAVGLVVNAVMTDGRSLRSSSRSPTHS